jgi:hypothetical protein
MSDIPFAKGTDEWAAAVSERYPTLSKDDVLGIYDYTTNDGYDVMNGYLRNPAAHDTEAAAAAQQRVDRAVAGLEKLPQYDGVSYRGTNLPPDVLKAWEPGEVVSDKAFMSSSVDRRVADSFGKEVFMRIVGHSGVDIAPLSRFANEVEILFKPGTEFRVLSKTWDDQLKRWNLELEEVP